MAKVGLKFTAISASTRDEASRLHNEELWVTVHTSGNVVLAGPEQFKCAEFEKAVQDNIFWTRTKRGCNRNLTACE